MARCSENAITPGTPTLSSGYTARLAAEANRCDQARILERLRGGTGGCLPQPTPGRGAVYASVKEQEAATRCQVPQAIQRATFPRVGVPESVRIQKLIFEAEQCANNQFNPATRFASYARVVPLPCPVTPMNTTPKPTFRPGCPPSRFF